MSYTSDTDERLSYIQKKHIEKKQAWKNARDLLDKDERELLDQNFYMSCRNLKYIKLYPKNHFELGHISITEALISISMLILKNCRWLSSNQR